MNTQTAGAIGLIGAAFALVLVAIFGVMIASMWKVFRKAGQPGWAAIMPIYNLVVLLRITGKPGWWLVLFCLPGANLVALILVSVALARSFGKSTGFGLGLLALGVVFYPILAFGDAYYRGPEPSAGGMVSAVGIEPTTY